MNAFILGDARLCIGCQACMVACAQSHEELTTATLNDQQVPFHSRIQVINAPEVTVAVQCRQCEDSPCARSCPVDAIVQRDDHIEVIKGQCIGCKSCVLACPFGAIRVQEDARIRSGIYLTTGAHQNKVEKSQFVALKCDLCAGSCTPACIDICPAGALQLIEPEAIAQKIALRRQQNAGRMQQYRSQQRN